MSESTKSPLSTAAHAAAPGDAVPGTADPVTGGISRKGLSVGTVGVLGALVMGISCIAPAYTFTAAVGPTASVVGAQIPAVILLGFLPMLLRAVGSATDPTVVVDRLLGVREVFGDDLPASDVFRDLLVTHLKELM